MLRTFVLGTAHFQSRPLAGQAQQNPLWQRGEHAAGC